MPAAWLPTPYMLVPMFPRSPVNRALATFCVGLLATAGLAVAAMALISHYAFGPTAPVRSYMQAIQNGDGGKAMDLMNADVPDSNAAMLDGRSLSEATRTLDHLRYSVHQESEDSAVVTVEYRLNGATSSTEFPVHRTGVHAGVLEDWSIDSRTLPTVKVSTPGVETATVNRQKVGVQGGDQDFAVFYPGVYTAEYTSSLVTAPETTTTVTDPEPGHDDTNRPSLSLKPAPSRHAKDSIKSQVSGKLDECARQNTLYPKGCPFEYEFRGRVQGGVHWSISEYPDSSATVDQQGRWKLTNPKGKAQIEFQSLDLYTGTVSTVKKTVPFQLNAALQVKGDQVVVNTH